MKQFATSLFVVAMLTQSASSVALREASNSESSIWAEIEMGATHHKHHEHHHKDKAEKAEEKKPAEKPAESKEAAAIKDTAVQGLASLEKEDASLSDMLSFSKQVAQTKTQDQIEQEEQAKQQLLAQQVVAAQAAKKAELAKLNEKTDAEKEEDEVRQKAIDVTERKMLAQKYEQMMIEDEKRDGIDNGGSSFQVIADQAKEQDYAINTFKGSGEMSEMLSSMEQDAKKAQDKKIMDEALSKAAAKSKSASDVSAANGESLIKGDSDSMYEFSKAVADNAQ